jgi:hypothetical protein
MCTDTKGKRLFELDMRVGRARFHRALFEFHGRVRLCRTPTSSPEIESGLKSRPTGQEGKKKCHGSSEAGVPLSFGPPKTGKKTAISALLQPPKIGLDRSQSDSIGVNRTIQYCIRMAKSHDDRQLGKLRKKMVSQNPSLSSLTCYGRVVSIRWQKRHRAGRGLKPGICAVMARPRTPRRGVSYLELAQKSFAPVQVNISKYK